MSEEKDPQESLEMVVRQVRTAVHASHFGLEVGFGDGESFTLKKAGETYRVSVSFVIPEELRLITDLEDDEIEAQLEAILATPGLAEEAYPDPEMRAKILPLVRYFRRRGKANK